LEMSAATAGSDVMIFDMGSFRAGPGLIFASFLLTGRVSDFLNSYHSIRCPSLGIGDAPKLVSQDDGQRYLGDLAMPSPKRSAAVAATIVKVSKCEYSVVFHVIPESLNREAES
jgi:hypothetical protein